eukprot:TRINITY_DN390_c0_g3_i1.p1 TRINITY_DN390_c0_g3~~TRINITY_DN390_c0_g3_i1.p1  ORF type:complete len:966 (+),score=361.59 TRINITY_DN390_c0_g3_i1:98-2995(+)
MDGKQQSSLDIETVLLENLDLQKQISELEKSLNSNAPSEEYIRTIIKDLENDRCKELERLNKTLNQRLDATIKSSEKIIGHLRKENDQLLKSVDELHVQLKAKSKASSVLRRGRNVAPSRATANEIRGLKEKLQNMEDQFHNSEEELRMVKIELGTSRNTAADAKRQMLAEKRKANKLQTTVSNLREQLSEFIDNNDEIERSDSHDDNEAFDRNLSIDTATGFEEYDGSQTLERFDNEEDDEVTENNTQRQQHQQIRRSIPSRGKRIINNRSIRMKSSRLNQNEENVGRTAKASVVRQTRRPASAERTRRRVKPESSFRMRAPSPDARLRRTPSASQIVKSSNNNEGSMFGTRSRIPLHSRTRRPASPPRPISPQQSFAASRLSQGIPSSDRPSLPKKIARRKAETTRQARKSKSPIRSLPTDAIIRNRLLRSKVSQSSQASNVIEKNEYIEPKSMNIRRPMPPTSIPSPTERSISMSSYNDNIDNNKDPTSQAQESIVLDLLSQVNEDDSDNDDIAISDSFSNALDKLTKSFFKDHEEDEKPEHENNNESESENENVNISNSEFTSSKKTSKSDEPSNLSALQNLLQVQLDEREHKEKMEKEEQARRIKELMESPIQEEQQQQEQQEEQQHKQDTIPQEKQPINNSSSSLADELSGLSLEELAFISSAISVTGGSSTTNNDQKPSEPVMIPRGISSDLPRSIVTSSIPDFQEGAIVEPSPMSAIEPTSTISVDNTATLFSSKIGTSQKETSHNDSGTSRNDITEPTKDGNDDLDHTTNALKALLEKSRAATSIFSSNPQIQMKNDQLKLETEIRPILSENDAIKESSEKKIEEISKSERIENQYKQVIQERQRDQERSPKDNDQERSNEMKKQEAEKEEEEEHQKDGIDDDDESLKAPKVKRGSVTGYADRVKEQMTSFQTQLLDDQAKMRERMLRLQAQIQKQKNRSSARHIPPQKAPPVAPI